MLGFLYDIVFQLLLRVQLGKVAFRVDASVRIGIGHAVRCLTLANQLQKEGKHCYFICRSLPHFLREMLILNGHVLHILPRARFPQDRNGYDAWLEANPTEDAEQSREALKGLKPEWLIVDHYSLGYSWETMQRAVVSKIMAIDDLANRHHNCDILLDQNLRDGNPYEKLINPETPVLLGPAFALLRPEFLRQRTTAKVKSGQICRVLVFFGGSDPTGDTLKTAMALACFEGLVEVEIIVGEINPSKEIIKAYCEQYEFLNFACQVDDMAERFSRADLCIGAGGSASWERLAVGLPTLTVVQEENQAENARQVEKHGVALCLGRSQFVTSEMIRKIVAELISSGQERLHRMSSLAFDLVDGNGPLRVIKAMDAII